MKSTLFTQILISCLFALSLSTKLHSQTAAKWMVNGNATVSGDFLGTTNNQPLIFFANNSEGMRLKENGDLRVNSLGGIGNNFVFSHSNGVLYTKPFSSDTNKFMTEAGVFRTASSFTGWKFNGNNIHTINGSFVGIGTTSPQYQLDVNGDARFNGTLYSNGLVLATKMQADTMKSSSIISVNNNLNFSAGLLNEMYTYNGDVRIQSKSGYNGNTVFNAGTSGNVGIGTYTPTAKLDVNGNMRLSGTLTFSALATGTPVQVCIDAAGNFTPIPILNPGNNACNTTSIYDWNTRGNAATDENLDFVGTCDQAPLIFRTFNVERMRISETGEFGLGNGHTGNTFFVVPQLVANSYNAISQTGDVGIFWSDSYGGNSNSSFVIAPFSHTALGLRITADGNVGIGTATPQYTLDINGTINATQVLQNGSPLFSPWIQTGDDIFFDQNSITGGSVGIGVAGTSSFFTCPSCTGGKYLLAVDGGIRAKALKVEPLWSDYVFDSAYNLTPLDSISAYIKENHHLPGVPSAQYVKENGIDVGDTEAMLLAKIEELTLYMIQLQQQNATMQKEIDALKR